MKVSVIIPCYNEEEVLPLSHRRFSQVMGSIPYDYELIFINDGSKDRTEELLMGFAQNDPHTKVLSFSAQLRPPECRKCRSAQLHGRCGRHHRRPTCKTRPR